MDTFTRDRAKRAREEAAAYQSSSSSSLSVVIGRRPGGPRVEPAPPIATNGNTVMKGVTPMAMSKPVVSKPSAVGTSMVLDKAYVRPATAPNMQQVRPLHILQRSFQQALQGASSSAPPPAKVPLHSVGLVAISPNSQLEVLADKLKSIRQDLTIQALETDFTSLVYETHARLCIVLNHTTDFGQCLNYVKKLHSKGLSGRPLHHMFDDPLCAGLPTVVRPPVDCAPMLEFAAFRIVYSGLTTHVSSSTGGGSSSNGADESAVANELSWVDRFCPNGTVSNTSTTTSSEDESPQTLFTSSWDHPTVDFAIKSVEYKGNAVPFMQLVKCAPSYCLRQLLMLFVPRLRLEWLKCVAESFADFLPATVLMTFLGYRSAEEVRQALSPLLGNKYNDGFRGRECKNVLVQHIELLTRGKQ